MMPTAKSITDANEIYYAEHSQYAPSVDKLNVTVQGSSPDGMQIELGNDPEYAYVIATNPMVKNNYIQYQKYSENYPGEIHCEALKTNAMAKWLCGKALGGREIGRTLTDGYITYVLEGGLGAGTPPGTPMTRGRDAAQDMGYSCTMTENEDGTSTKKVCYSDMYCMSYDYDANGDVTTKTSCKMSGNVCKTDKVNTYDANGNITTEKQYYKEISDENLGTTIKYTYDANGHITGSQDRTITLSQTTYTIAGLMGSTAKGSSTLPIYWTGTAFSTISSYQGNSATATKAT
jgi:YD repeat-containing protein